MASDNAASRNLLIPLYSASKTPILLIPGILGSHRFGTTELSPSLPLERSPPVSSLELHNPLPDYVGWSKLKQVLASSCGYVYPIVDVPWDWRLSVEEAAEKYLKPAIKEAKDKYHADQVSIIAHSAGGLVSRAFIQDIREKGYDWESVRRLALVGTPHLGAVTSYYLWAFADPLNADNINGVYKYNLYWDTTEDLYEYEDIYNLGKLKSDQHETIWKFYHEQANIDLLRDLLPMFPFLEYQNGWYIHSEVNKDHILRKLNSDPKRLQRMSADGQDGTILTKVFAGVGKNTLALVPVNRLDDNNQYQRGILRSDKDATKDEGDGTVLKASAKLPLIRKAGPTWSLTR